MFGRKKKPNDMGQEIVRNESIQHRNEITILVTDEDKTGSDVTKMSDFFSVALQDMSKELVSPDSLISIDELPISNLSAVNEAIQTIGAFRSPEFDLLPDFSALPKDIQEKYKSGKLILGESKQVEGNIRAVLVDAETKERVKDVTLKKVERIDSSGEISRNMLNQMQLRQISQKLDYMMSEQSYLIDFSRNQTIIKPFLDARDSILQAQGQIELTEQKLYLTKASESLKSAINAVYVDMNTLEGDIAVEANRKWFQITNRKKIDACISRLAADTMILTKYVGMQMQVYFYLGDSLSSQNVLDGYRSNMHRFFEKGVISSDKTLALFIHENVDYTEDNKDCWYYMEERMKPLLESEYDNIEAKTVIVITGGDEDECKEM